ncbi:MAG: hypothetical protein OER95_05655 [Acidimicrobiia bacterium]|nr:hypothetical protein [Acidimicrobiia bacterium]
MTSWDSYVDDPPLAATEPDIDRWPEATASPNRFQLPGQPSRDRWSMEPVEHNDGAYPRRLELSDDSRRARFIDWLFSAPVRRNALAITTFALLGFGGWLLATELAGPTRSSIDFAAFHSSEPTSIQSSSTPEVAEMVKAETANENGADSTEGRPVAAGNVEPTTISNGRVELSVAPTATGWTASVTSSPGSSDSNDPTLVTVLVNGSVIKESALVPVALTIDPETAGDDVATFIVSVVVENAGEMDGVDGSGPLSVAVAANR